MKTKSLSLLLLSSLFALFFVACESDDNGDVVVPNVSTGVFVLNQGSWHQNNSSISYYDFTTKTTTTDIFSAANDRGLGDGGQDALLYGSNLYVTVTESSVLEVIDPKTGISKKSISIINENVTRQPRSMVAYNGNIYITLFDGNVAKLDTTTLTIQGYLSVGVNPEEIVAANNLLYVAVSGAYGAFNNSIVVIDPTTFKELRKIEVVVNPTKLVADSQGDVYVISNGDYGTIKASLQRIAKGTEVVTKIAGFEPMEMAIYNDHLYFFSFTPDYVTHLASNKKFIQYDALTESVVKENFITNDPTTKMLYSSDADPTNGDIYISETDYSAAGKMYVFKNDGSNKENFSVGVNAYKTVFITK